MERGTKEDKTDMKVNLKGKHVDKHHPLKIGMLRTWIVNLQSTDGQSNCNIIIFPSTLSYG